MNYTGSEALPLASLVIFIPLIVFWIWMFRDMVHNDYITDHQRLIWIIGFIFVSILTAGYYYFAEYKVRR